MRYLLFAVVLLLSAKVYAETPDIGDSSLPDSRQPENDTHPTLSADGIWAGSMVIGIGGLFLAAMVVGPMVRAEREEEVPVAVHADAHAHHH